MEYWVRVAICFLGITAALYVALLFLPLEFFNDNGRQLATLLRGVR